MVPGVRDAVMRTAVEMAAAVGMMEDRQQMMM